MSRTILNDFGAALAGLCPWRGGDDEWFRLTALVAALLLTILLAAVAASV